MPEGALRDFTTYFGSYCSVSEENPANINKDKLNDVILPKNDGFGGRHFMIRYIVEKNHYLLKDLGEGTGTFIKVSDQVILKNGHIISFGEFHLVVGLIYEKAMKNESECSKSSARMPKQSSSRMNLSSSDK